MQNDGESCTYNNLERASSFLEFMRSRPILPPIYSSKLEIFMRKEFKIDDTNFQDLKTQREESVLREVERLHQRSYTKWIVPPVQKCIFCSSYLTTDKEGVETPLNVVLHDIDGPHLAAKMTLRCRKHEKEIRYRVDTYGNSSIGWKFYTDMELHIIEASNVTYLTSRLMKNFIAMQLHVYAGFSGAAEVYNSTHRDTDNVHFLRAIDLVDRSKVAIGDDTVLHKETGYVAGELNRHQFAMGYYRYEVLCEIRERGLEQPIGFDGHSDRSINEMMAKIMKLRENEIYKHTHCHPDCIKRGCGKLCVMDGLHKFSCVHCLMEISGDKEKAMNALNLPTVCPETPVDGSAFCDIHCKALREKGFEIIGLRDFLLHCGANPTNYTKDDRKKVRARTIELSLLIGENVKTPSAIANFTSRNLIDKVSRKDPTAFDRAEELPEEMTCTKDLGNSQQLRGHSRGILAMIEGGGIIRSWCHIYRSESLSQAALFVIAFFLMKFKAIQESQWATQKFYLSYDNMCQLANMKIWRSPLPLTDKEGSRLNILSNMWTQNITKA